LPAILAIFLALAASCVTNINENNPGVDDGERLVTLALTVPGTPATRALPKDDAWENAVNTVDVLLFDASGNFKYRAIGSTVADEPSALPAIQKSFTVKLPVCTNHSIVVLANARAALAASTVTLPVSTLSSGPGRAAVLDNLVQELANPADKWTDEFETNGIPMWGYHDGLTIALDVTPSVPVIALTRSVARVDLQVGEDADDIFSLASAHLYKYHRAGSLAPAVAATGYDAAQWDGSKATAPHLPALTSLANQVTPLKVSGTPLSYSIHAGATVVLGKIENPVHLYNQYIYTFEADAVTAGAQTNTCLVIGGYYNHNPAPTYYRVDFAKDNGDCLPLLRNHRYIVTIKEVHASGYPTKEEAYANKPSNIKVEILPWNGGGLGHVIFNDQHYLAVDRDELEFPRTGGDQHVSVATDFGSWTIEDKPAWVTVSPNTFTGGETVTDITVTADLLASGSRAGEFYIVAGNLRKKITLLQQQALELSVTPARLVFDSNGDPVGTGTLTVLASIAGLPRAITVAGDIAWISGRSPANFTGTTSTTYAFQPTARAVGSNESLAGEITITVADAGRQVTRRVTVIQLPVGKAFFTITANPYQAAGGVCNFSVISARQWQISDGDNSAGAITLTDLAQHPAGPITNYTFTLLPSPVYALRDIHLKATLDGGPETENVTIVQSGTPLVFDITSPSGNTLDIDMSTTTPADVTLSTNAIDWYYTVLGGKTLDGFTAVSVTTLAFATDATQTVTPTITFTPLEDAASTEKAGTVIDSRTLQFATRVNTPGLDEITRQLTLNLVVPAKLDFVSSTPADGGTIPQAGGTVEIEVLTNTGWWVKYAGNTRNYEETIDGYQACTMEIEIPANTAAGKNFTFTIGIAGDNDVKHTVVLSQGGVVQEVILVTEEYTFTGIEFVSLTTLSLLCPDGYKKSGNVMSGYYITGQAMPGSIPRLYTSFQTKAGLAGYSGYFATIEWNDEGRITNFHDGNSISGTPQYPFTVTFGRACLKE
jgi:hypothetical protein